MIFQILQDVESSNEVTEQGDETTNQAADLVELGMRHYGMGVKGTASGYLEALELFRKAADQGYAEAQSMLGSMCSPHFSSV